MTKTSSLSSALGNLADLTGRELVILAGAAQALVATQSPSAIAEPRPSGRAWPQEALPQPFPPPARRKLQAPVEAVATTVPFARASIQPTRVVAKVACRLGGQGRGMLLEGRRSIVDPELFASAAYRRRLGTTVPGLLYAAGSDGLLALAERLDEPVYKAGVAEGATIVMRMSMLAATRYGSVVRTDEGWIEEEGFDHWRARDLPMSKQRGRRSPVKAALRAIAYDRPATLPHTVLDRAIAAALAPAGLDAFIRSDAGLARCQARSLDPVAFERYSPAPHGCPQGAVERACELVLLGPRADADRIADVLEAIIAGHVMARAPT